MCQFHKIPHLLLSSVEFRLEMSQLIACQQRWEQMHWLSENKSTSLNGRIKKKIFTHRYVKSVAVWDLIVDDGLYIDCLQLELYGDINKPWNKMKRTDRRKERGKPTQKQQDD